MSECEVVGIGESTIWQVMGEGEYGRRLGIFKAEMGTYLAWASKIKGRRQKNGFERHQYGMTEQMMGQMA